MINCLGGVSRDRIMPACKKVNFLEKLSKDRGFIYVLQVR